jgi:hypothetical protein
MFVTVYLLYGTQGKRKRQREDRASVTHTTRCEGRGYKDMY